MVGIVVGMDDEMRGARMLWMALEDVERDSTPPASRSAWSSCPVARCRAATACTSPRLRRPGDTSRACGPSPASRRCRERACRRRRTARRPPRRNPRSLPAGAFAARAADARRELLRALRAEARSVRLHTAVEAHRLAPVAEGERGIGFLRTRKASPAISNSKLYSAFTPMRNGPAPGAWPTTGN